MTETVRIYYIGHKAVKKDNIMRDSGRVWQGFGTYHDVWAPDAPKYLRYADVWSDQEPTGQAPVVESPKDDDQAPPETRKANPYEDDERMSAIIEGIQKLSADDFTSQGNPKVKAVTQAVGFSVAASEIADAKHYLDQLKGS